MSLREGTLTSSSSQLETSHDPAATLCAFLIAKRGWSLSHTARTLGLPPLVLEECIRSGVASAALRSQLALWISEGKEPDLPSALVRGVVEAAAVSLGASASLQDGDPFAALDPTTQGYFVELSSNVGQSFISILNDPRDSADNSDWVMWLGSVVSGVLDYKGQAKRLDTSSTINLSSESLLARYSLNEDYSSYLKLVSTSYNRNREEGRLTSASTSSLMITTPLDINVKNVDTNKSPKHENLPWPDEIPKEFFSFSHDPGTELKLLEKKLIERIGEMEIKNTKKEKEGKNGREREEKEGKCVLFSSETFSEDFEVMESRMKELRQWESSVESCLLQHVQSRSEEFFSVSHEFGDRAAEARRTLEDLQQTRVDVNMFGNSLVEEMMSIAQLYRVRNNLRGLCNLTNTVISVSSQVSAIENWVALPERDMMELPSVVESFSILEETVMKGSKDEKLLESNNSSKIGIITNVVAIKNVFQRVLFVKESLCKMIMNEIEIALIPSVKECIDDGHIVRAFLSSFEIGIWPTAMQHCKSLIIDNLWMIVRENFIAFMMGNCELSDRIANEILSIAETPNSSREDKLLLLSKSNICGLSLYIQLVEKILDRILDFVVEAFQRWGILIVEGSSQIFSSTFDGISMEEMTKKYISSICGATESIVALLLEVRSYSGKAPVNIRELETLISMGCNILPKIVNSLKEVLVICKNNDDPWKFISGKQIKSAVTKLAKEHFKSRHTESIEKMRVTIENETWQPDNVDPALQSSVDILCSSDDKTIRELKSRALFSNNSNDNKLIFSVSIVSKIPISELPKSKFRSLANNETIEKKLLLLPSENGKHLEGRVVSGSLQLLIGLLQEYDDYLGRFPFLAFDVMGKIYDLLKLYVSQCAALLLGAMAVENGALQTITTQNMAIASQNLAFLFDSIPLMLNRWIKAISSEKIPPSISDDMKRVCKDCATYRCELFDKISTLVKDKVNSLGTISVAQWKISGNEWVMTMLRETARLIRVLKPILPTIDSRGVIVPLLGTFARMIRAVTVSPGVDADLRAIMLSDVLLFKANVERFGFDVIRCAMFYKSPVDAMTESVEPCTTESVVVAWFFSGDEP